MAQTPEYIPTREEIHAACLGYQAGWSVETERNRAAWARRRFEVLATRFLIDEGG